MSEFHAYRNLKLCSKDCLCLFVCPTGATNNETDRLIFLNALVAVHVQCHVLQGR